MSGGARPSSAAPPALGAPRTDGDDRDSLEFGRVVNLSDALFAIAMTLLVFKVGVPETAADGWSAGAVAPQLLAFLLSFAVVANFWWQHHALFRLLARVEPGLIGINLALLGAVALVPFPTELIGAQPGASVPAFIYLGLMLVISVLHLLLVRRAEAVRAWRTSVAAGVGGEVQAGWLASISVIAAALLVAVWVPVLGLGMLLATGPADRAAVIWRRRARS